MCTFQSGKFTCWGSEGVNYEGQSQETVHVHKPQRLKRKEIPSTEMFY